MNQTVGLATPLIGLFLELEFQSGKVILQDVEQPVYSPISGPFSPIWTSNGITLRCVTIKTLKAFYPQDE